MPRRSRRVNTTKAKYNTGAKAQAGQIVKLQKQVNYLDSRTKDLSKFAQYNVALSDVHSGGLTQPSYKSHAIIVPKDWTPIFQADNASTDSSKFKAQSIRFQLLVQLDNPEISPDPVIFSVFIVKLRKETAAQTITDTSNVTVLQLGIDYIQTTLGSIQGAGHIYLNPGRYKVVKALHGMVGTRATPELVDGADTTNLKDNNWIRRFTIPYKNLIKSSSGSSQTGYSAGWKNLSANQVQHNDRMYMMFFPNNYADQTVFMASNLLINGRTTT